MPIVGLGIDLVEIQRVEHLVSRNEEIFRARILGESERLEIPASASKHKRLSAYARSIAAKEAFFKALGTGLARGMRWPEVEIVQQAKPKPMMAIHGEAARVLASLNADDIQLSLSSLPAHGQSPGQAHLGQVSAIVLLTRDEARVI